MNSLQAGLIGVAVLVIALFAAWMWWQNWRNHRGVSTKLSQRSAPSTRATRDGSDDAPTTFAKVQPPITTTIGARRDPVLSGEEQAPLMASSAPAVTQSDVAVAQMYNGAPRPASAAFELPAAAVSSAPAPRYGSTPESQHASTPIHTSSVMPPSAAQAAELAPKASALPSALPVDDRLNVYATISATDGQAIDVQDFASLAERSLAWGRVFRLSAWEYIEELASGGAVQALCLAMPIASRAGPLTDADVLDWKRAVSAVATPLGFDATYGGDVGVGARAIELDQFLAAADVICVLYLVRKDGDAWSGTRLRGTLEANGFRLQADGRFVYFEVESESPIFSAVDGFERSFTPERLRTETVTALRLVFEASNVAHPVARFDVYRQTLRALARLLEADIKDSSGAVVGDTEFTAIRADVVAGSSALEEAGIECGSPAAHALFR